jgi:hypothetical protein
MKPTRTDAVKIACWTFNVWLTLVFGRAEKVYVSRTGTK